MNDLKIDLEGILQKHYDVNEGFTGYEIECITNAMNEAIRQAVHNTLAVVAEEAKTKEEWNNEYGEREEWKAIVDTESILNLESQIIKELIP